MHKGTNKVCRKAELKVKFLVVPTFFILFHCSHYSWTFWRPRIFPPWAWGELLGRDSWSQDKESKSCLEKGGGTCHYLGFLWGCQEIWQVAPLRREQPQAGAKGDLEVDTYASWCGFYQTCLRDEGEERRDAENIEELKERERQALGGGWAKVFVSSRVCICGLLPGPLNIEQLH